MSVRTDLLHSSKLRMTGDSELRLRSNAKYLEGRLRGIHPAYLLRNAPKWLAPLKGYGRTSAAESSGPVDECGRNACRACLDRKVLTASSWVEIYNLLR